MKRRFDDKGPNFIFIGAAVLVLFGMIWLSCHQREFIDAFTDEPADETPSGSLRSPAPPAGEPEPAAASATDAPPAN